MKKPARKKHEHKTKNSFKVFNVSAQTISQHFYLIIVQFVPFSTSPSRPLWSPSASLSSGCPGLRSGTGSSRSPIYGSFSSRDQISPPSCNRGSFCRGYTTAHFRLIKQPFLCLIALLFFAGCRSMKMYRISCVLFDFSLFWVDGRTGHARFRVKNQQSS